MITRKVQTRIEYLLQNNPAVALIGPRQAGKTTLARIITESFPTPSIFLDLENRNDAAKLTDPMSYFANNDNKLVVIDEVQTMPELYRDLRPAIDANRRNGRFLLLGSAAPSLVRGVSESLTGRIDYAEITPFNLTELIKGMLKKEVTTVLREHWFRGGLPLSFLAASDKTSEEWRNAYLKSYISSEFSIIFPDAINQNIISNFWRMTAHLTGSLMNYENLSKSLGVSVPTVKKYSEYLEAAFHIRRLQPWFINTGKRLVKSPKIYIRDSGLLHTLLQITEPESLMGHPIVGNSWEGYVIEQILQLTENVAQGYFYRTHQGSEIDLLIIKGLKPIASIEIKLSDAPKVSKGFYEAITTLRTEKNYIITPSSDIYPLKENITVCSLPSFLQEILPTIL